MDKKAVKGILLGLGILTLGVPGLRADRVLRQAEVTGMQGKVEWLKSGTGDWQALGPDQKLEAGDKIRTAADGKVTLKLDDGSVFELTPNAEFSVSALSKDSADEKMETVVALLKGRLRARVTPLKEGSSFEIETPVMVAAVLGTTLNVGINEDGSVSASSEEGNVQLTRTGETQFTALLETGEEALVNYDPLTGELTVTCVSGTIIVIGPDGIPQTLNPGDSVVFKGGAATFIPANDDTTDPPGSNAAGEPEGTVTDSLSGV